MKTYRINRNGSIRGLTLGAHKCGSPSTKVYHYHATIEVTGQLQGPLYFIVDNYAIDGAIQTHFKAHPEGRSCERMADEICDLVRHLLDDTSWRVDSVSVELTGTNGLAWLSAHWRPSSVAA